MRRIKLMEGEHWRNVLPQACECELLQGGLLPSTGSRVGSSKFYMADAEGVYLYIY
jgi:hypothetical protein